MGNWLRKFGEWEDEHHISEQSPSPKKKSPEIQPIQNLEEVPTLKIGVSDEPIKENPKELKIQINEESVKEEEEQKSPKFSFQISDELIKQEMKENPKLTIQISDESKPERKKLLIDCFPASEEFRNTGLPAEAGSIRDFGRETCRKEWMMQVSTKECSKVEEYLYCSGMEIAKNINILEEVGITFIVNCARTVIPNYFESNPGFEYLTLFLCDSSQEPISCYFNEVIQIVERERKTGGKTLIHCQMGISRSCAFVVAYLMAKYGMSFEDAFNKLKAARMISNPNIGFIAQLMEWDDYRRSPAKIARMFHVGPYVPPKVSGIKPKVSYRATMMMDHQRVLIPAHISLLESRSVFLMHKNTHVYVWCGADSSEEARNYGMEEADRIVRFQAALPPAIMSVIIEHEGKESKDFWSDIAEENNQPEIDGEKRKNIIVGKPKDFVVPKTVERFDHTYDIAEKAKEFSGDLLEDSDSDIENRPDLFMYHPSSASWEHLGVYDEDDLKRNSMLCLQTDDKDYVWLGTDFICPISRSGLRTFLKKHLARIPNVRKRPAKNEHGEEYSVPMVVERDGMESDYFWEMFESGY
eukprot:TRINITY_DN151492_c0_g2_i1.p1 TRINITY_DN151492_c0_g2~~TRINITY_DN151492_c0_g2_i1.p1  ORF type:complete len:583 (+),score=186.04 TRINITY_DN151492_c0_g2_i1:71-1819(+)